MLSITFRIVEDCDEKSLRSLMVNRRIKSAFEVERDSDRKWKAFNYLI